MRKHGDELRTQPLGLPIFRDQEESELGSRPKAGPNGRRKSKGMARKKWTFRVSNRQHLIDGGR